MYRSFKQVFGLNRVFIKSLFPKGNVQNSERTGHEFA